MSLIQAPLTGATPGTWQVVQFSGNGIGMNYCVLLPYNYNSANSYPLLVYLHENGYGSDQTGNFCLYNYESQGQGCDIWFNNAIFRRQWPCIVFVPLLNENQDGSGNTQNWGGWGGPNPQPSQLNCLTIIQRLITQYSVYTPKIYVTGDSLGGIGTWEFMIQYNAQTGLSGNKIFAAGWSESGGVNLYGNPPNQNVVTALRNVPIFAVRGVGDTSTGPDWDPQMYAAYGGGAANGSKAPNGAMWYINDPNLGHDVWGTYRNLTASFGSIQPATDKLNWLFSQTASGIVVPTTPTAPTTPTPTPIVKSVTNITISSLTQNSASLAWVDPNTNTPTPTVPTPPFNVIIPGVGSFTDPIGHVYTISAAGAAMEDGTPIPGGDGTSQMVLYNGTVYAQDVNSLQWYTWNQTVFTPSSAPPSSPPPPTTPTPTPVSTGNFRIANGLFIDPSGANFIGRGVNLYSIDQAVTNTACQPLTTLFPNIGIIRLNIGYGSYPSVASLSTYIDRLVALNIVVAIEDHMYPSTSPAISTAQNNWYASFAAHYKNEPFVWFMTTNEPADPNVTANHVAIYNAIRNTGSNAIVLFDPISGGGPNRQGPSALDASQYTGMHNAGWDQHFYAWMVGYTGNQSTINSTLAQFIAQDRQMISQDGVMPVLVGEWGDSTDGSNVDGDWQNIVSAVTTCGYGSTAWNYDQLSSADILVSGGNLTSYGQLVSNYVAAGTRAKR